MEVSKSNPIKPAKVSGTKIPKLSVLAAKQFPQDFFGEDCKINQWNYKRSPSLQSKDNKCEEMKKLEKRNYLYSQTEYNDNCIQEIIIEPEIHKKENMSAFSHRQHQQSTIKELDFFLDNDEPSTSGSYQGLNQLSNGNTPTCIDQMAQMCYGISNDTCFDSNLFKETAHFFRCDTEVKHQEPKRHSLTKSELPKSCKGNNEKSSPLKTRNSSKRISERNNSASVRSQKNQKAIQSKAMPAVQRPKSVLSKSKPMTLSKTQQVFKKELVSLIDNVTREYIEDPEIKQGLNMLCKNLNDFKQIINKKKFICGKSQRETQPIHSYKQALNKKDNNKPIKIVNNRKKSINH